MMFRLNCEHWWLADWLIGWWLVDWFHAESGNTIVFVLGLCKTWILLIRWARTRCSVWTANTDWILWIIGEREQDVPSERECGDEHEEALQPQREQRQVRKVASGKRGLYCNWTPCPILLLITLTNGWLSLIGIGIGLALLIAKFVSCTRACQPFYRKKW